MPSILLCFIVSLSFLLPNEVHRILFFSPRLPRDILSTSDRGRTGYSIIYSVTSEIGTTSLQWTRGLHYYYFSCPHCVHCSEVPPYITITHGYNAKPPHCVHCSEVPPYITITSHGYNAETPHCVHCSEVPPYITTSHGYNAETPTHLVCSSLIPDRCPRPW